MCRRGGCVMKLWWKSLFLYLMIRRPPRSTQGRSSAASDVYKRQAQFLDPDLKEERIDSVLQSYEIKDLDTLVAALSLSLIHISEPTRPY